ncbi:FAD-dependent oxidoreductase [Chloroflexota bacterium]
MERFAKLLEPGQLGKIKSKNRLLKSANGSSFIETTGFVGDRALAYYEALARGGLGIVIVESCGVEFPLGCQHVEHQFRLSDDKFIPSFSELAKVVHKHGAAIMIQFQHAGPWDPTGLLPERDTKAASALTRAELPGPDFAVPRAMTSEEVQEYIQIWAKAAERAWKAGFDGCEINGATCHQINTFFSRIWNKREDEYGSQSVANRARYMCDIVREAKKKCGPDFTVTCLLNVREYNHPKATTLAEGVQFAKLLQDAGADGIQVRAHIYGHREGLLQPDRLLYPEAPKWLNTELGELDWSRKGHGATVPLAAAVKKAVTVPVYCACRLNPDLGEKFLREGKIDFVPMTRRLLADHDLPNKVIAGKLEDIRPCSGCLHCMDLRNKNKPMECRVNPDLSRERQFEIKPAAKKKNVMVVGGGLSGIEAALVAAQRGHKVTLYEKTSKLGGLVPIAALVKDLETDVLLDLLRWFKLQLTKNNVTIKTGTNVTTAMIEQMKPDAVVLALGGTVIIPQIPGIDRKNVNILTKMDKLLLMLGPKLTALGSKIMMPGVGKHVVVMGGEHHGCEIAEFLIKRGRKVTVVHTGTEFAEGMTVDDKLRLFPWFDEKGVKLIGGVKYEEVTEKGLIVTTKEGKKMLIEADTVMPSLFLKQNLDMAKKLEGKLSEVFTVGSCFKPEPDLMVDAIYAGAEVGHKI